MLYDCLYHLPTALFSCLFCIEYTFDPFMKLLDHKKGFVANNKEDLCIEGLEFLGKASVSLLSAVHWS